MDTLVVVLICIVILLAVLYILTRKCVKPEGFKSKKETKKPKETKSPSTKKPDKKLKGKVNYGFTASSRSKLLTSIGETPTLVEEVFDIPESFTWGDVLEHKYYPELKGNYLVPTRNQHNPQQYCGSCFVFASVQTLGDRFNILNALKYGRRMPDVILSPQQILNCIKDPSNNDMTCLTGGDSSMVYEQILMNGIVDETCMPYTSQAIPTQCTPSCYTCIPPGFTCEESGLTDIRDGFTMTTPDCCKLCKDTPNGNDQYGNSCKNCDCHTKTGAYNYSITYGNFIDPSDPKLGSCCTVPKFPIYKIEGYSNITNRYKRLKNKIDYNKYIQQEIYMNGPVTIAVDASPIEKYTDVDGVISNNGNVKCQFEALNHLVCIVGWGVEKGVKYWILRNSWGTGYGKGGQFWIEMNDNCCGVGRLDNEVYGAYPLGWSEYTKYKTNQNVRLSPWAPGN